MPKNGSKEITAGTRFGKLTVKKPSHQDKRWRRFYLCDCDCGSTAIVQAGHLRSGNTQSCGCLAKETSAQRRLPQHHGEVTAIILSYKRHAKRRGLEWLLTRKDVTLLIRERCHYCGAWPTNTKRTKNSIDGLPYNGIDRVDSGSGYTRENAVTCCEMCNKAKRDYDIKTFLTWVRRVYNHQEAMATQWGSLHNDQADASAERR